MLTVCYLGFRLPRSPLANICLPLLRFWQREQMQEAQEMFKNANKVTRPEKALILGFMAGSRGTYLKVFDCIILVCVNIYPYFVTIAR